VISRAAEAPPSAGAVTFAAIGARIGEAVRLVASTEADPLDPFRGLYISDEAAVALTGEAGAPSGVDARIEGVAAALGLSPLDTVVLGVCAAPELDARFGRLLAFLHDDVTRRCATPRLVARIVGGDGDAERSAVLGRFAAQAPLRRTGALRLLDDADVALADRAVSLDERLVGRLLGADLAAAGRQRERLVPLRGAPVAGRPQAVAALRGVLAEGGGVPVVACGPDAPDVLAVALGRPVLLLDARDAAVEALLASARVHAALEGAALALALPDQLAPEERDAVARVVAAEPGVLLCAERREHAGALAGVGALIVEVPAPALAERLGFWSASAGGEADVAGVAAKFQLSAGQIDHAVRVARVAAAARGATGPRAEDLEQGAREASRTRLGDLAVLLDPCWGWDDLVLPGPALTQLRSVSAYLRHRDLVLGEWGYDHAAPSQGIKALFAGVSGTGKTMAAQIIAADLGLDVFRVDLATVVSKYIGETERNLDRIFAAAGGSNAILFFDEADALFGKRSEVRDAHDRYANIEVAYLLQRMEGYAGAVVLATNLRQNIDAAFARRIDVVVDFPFPGEEDRARIWRRLVPASAPVADDVDLDALAARYELSGGAIRTCSLAAAFMAADDGGRIEMRHLVAAVAAEYRKAGRLTIDGEFAHG
jgi:hypothetical protein